ncbi:hypothetical protein EYY60_01630, partial [Flavobacterium zhairuonense]|uniref:beta strand repeat-containing protein n=1 Tax=Flavobacterium zhairuonense TaxID=2493631 RepID=UPI0013C2F254
TVNGITSTGAPIVNTNETSLSGTSLTTTVNGVSSTALDLAPAISAGTTNALSLSGNTLTSNVNGVSSTSDAVSGVSNASTANTSTITVNGITSTGAPIVNTNETSLSGTSLTTTVNGVSSAALDLAPAIASGTTNALSLSGNTLTSNVNGVSSTSDAVSGVSNASTANTSTITVNGITSTGAPIINTNATSLAGTSLTTTVNGVASTALDLSPILASGTTHTLGLAGNTLTSNVNGVTATSSAVSGVSNASSSNTSTVTVNGITSTGAPIINTNTTSLTGTNLTTTVNGVSSTALNLAPAIAAGTTVSNTSSANTLSTTVNGVTGTGVNIINSNALSATNGNLVSTVNGIATTPSVPVLISANNGLGTTNGNTQLGGTLVTPTSIATNATNTLAISGLQASASGTDLIVVADNTGILKTKTSTLLNANNWNILGNAGTSPANNFLGTTDNQDLAFRTNNTEKMRILANGNVGVGTTSPKNKFSVSGGPVSQDDYANGDKFFLLGITGANKITLDTGFSTSNYSGQITDQNGNPVSTTTGVYNWYTANNGAWVQRMNLANDGSLTVGGRLRVTTIPAAATTDNLLSADATGNVRAAVPVSSIPLKSKYVIADVAAGATQSVTVTSAFDTYQLVVTVINGCGRSGVATFMVTSSNMIAFNGGQTTNAVYVATFGDDGNSQTLVGNTNGCADGGNSSALNYKILILGRSVSITNNGNLPRTYNITLVEM